MFSFTVIEDCSPVGVKADTGFPKPLVLAIEFDFPSFFKMYYLPSYDDDDDDDDDDDETKPLVAFQWLGSSKCLTCFAVGFKELSTSSDENEESGNER